MSGRPVAAASLRSGCESLDRPELATGAEQDQRLSKVGRLRALLPEGNDSLVVAGVAQIVPLGSLARPPEPMRWRAAPPSGRRSRTSPRSRARTARATSTRAARR